MTVAILALDDRAESHFAAITAANLFGPDAAYVAVHVGPSPTIVPEAAWGGVYGYPYAPVTATDLRDPDRRRASIEAARERAAENASAVGVDAIPVGDVGDPADVIMRVAAEHHADVVVVGDHHRGWFRSLFEDSVADDLVKSGELPILIVPAPE